MKSTLLGLLSSTTTPGIIIVNAGRTDNSPFLGWSDSGHGVDDVI